MKIRVKLWLTVDIDDDALGNSRLDRQVLDLLNDSCGDEFRRVYSDDLLAIQPEDEEDDQDPNVDEAGERFRWGVA